MAIPSRGAHGNSNWQAGRVAQITTALSFLQTRQFSTSPPMAIGGSSVPQSPLLLCSRVATGDTAMLVVMNTHATPEQIDAVLAAIRRMNLTPHPMPGAT